MVYDYQSLENHIVINDSQNPGIDVAEAYGSQSLEIYVAVVYDSDNLENFAVDLYDSSSIPVIKSSI